MTTEQQKQMKAYEAALSQHKPSLNIPLTEVVVFKLLEDLTPETEALIECQFATPSSQGEGVYCVGYGPSLDDARTYVLLFDWRRIQDHWDFWQTDNFLPVMETINKFFEPDAPLVRHFNFKPPGMLTQVHVRLLVWDEGAEKNAEDIQSIVTKDSKHAKEIKTGFAVDMGQMTWCAVALGYDSFETAREDNVEPKGEVHLCKLKYLKGTMG